MAMSEMKIEIPQQLIEDTIRAEIVRAIPIEKRDELIKAVIRVAMTQKKDDYSRTPTFFQDEVNKMIRETAIRIFEEWLEKNKKKVKDALLDYLNDEPQKRLTDFCEKLANNICEYGIRVELKLENKEW